MKVPILYIASRPVLPASGGRENMILQSLQFLEGKHEVNVVVFKGKDEVVDIKRYMTRFPSFKFHFVDLPGFRHWVLEWILTCRLLPLQVAMYLSRRGKSLIRSILAEEQCKLVIADMLRTSMLVPTGDFVSILELDDLLSLRYHHNIKTRAGNRPLGTYESRISPLAAKLVNRFSVLVLNYERWAIGRMERESARRHDAVVLVSHAEATLLRQMTGAENVYAIPPTTKFNRKGDRPLPRSGPINLMFVGNMQTTANRESVLYILQQVLPALDRHGVDYRFYAVGRCPPDILQRHQGSKVVFTGFLENAEDLFDKVHIHLAPMFGGTGVKTKILESLARGIPTITTPDGVIGLSVKSGEELFICTDEIDIVQRCVELANDESLYSHLSRTSIRFASEQFNFDTNQTRYLSILNACLSAPSSSGHLVAGVTQ
jgi:glycosyltransferase involved in cell wall biosynthesis